MVRAFVVIVALFLTSNAANALSADEKRSLAFQMALTGGSAAKCEWDTPEVVISNFAEAMKQLDILEYADSVMPAFMKADCNFANSSAKEKARQHYLAMKKLAKGVRQADPIMKMCRDKWGQNYEMIEHCVKNQRAAKQRLGID